MIILEYFKVQYSNVALSYVANLRSFSYKHSIRVLFVDQDHAAKKESFLVLFSRIEINFIVELN